jgi:hypothetical protein
MPQELPYLPSYKNVGLLFEKVKSAKIPEAFTTKFLAETLGLKSSGDRALITLLKSLGFLDNAGKPTEAYAALKNESRAKTEIARGVCRAYEPLFSANEKADSLTPEELRGLIAQVAGSDSGTTSKIVGTFRALCGSADFSKLDKEEKTEPEKRGEQLLQPPVTKPEVKTALRPEFHYNLQIHLPASGTEETYLNIFNAIRKVFS